MHASGRVLEFCTRPSITALQLASDICSESSSRKALHAPRMTLCLMHSAACSSDDIVLHALLSNGPVADHEFVSTIVHVALKKKPIHAFKKKNLTLLAEAVPLLN